MVLVGFPLWLCLATPIFVHFAKFNALNYIKCRFSCLSLNTSFIFAGCSRMFCGGSVFFRIACNESYESLPFDTNQMQPSTKHQLSQHSAPHNISSGFLQQPQAAQNSFQLG